MKTVRVFLADDHALVRAGIRSLLAEMDGVEVVAEAGEGHEALRLIAETKPDVAFLDIGMPGMNGLEVAGRVKREHPATRVVILSMHATEEYVLQALRAGASGYLLKDAETAELELALRAVMKGETYLTPAVSRKVIADYMGRVEGKRSQDTGAFGILTPRQREVLQMIAEGLTTKDIARKLNLSVKTVETHRMQLMERLDIHDIAGLVRYAIRAGLVSEER